MASNFIIEAWTELTVATLTIILRLYSSVTHKGWRAMTLDDYLMVLAGVSSSFGDTHMCLPFSTY